MESWSVRSAKNSIRRFLSKFKLKNPFKPAKEPSEFSSVSSASFCPVDVVTYSHLTDPTVRTSTPELVFDAYADNYIQEFNRELPPIPDPPKPKETSNDTILNFSPKALSTKFDLKESSQYNSILTLPRAPKNKKSPQLVRKLSQKSTLPKFTQSLDRSIGKKKASYILHHDFKTSNHLFWTDNVLETEKFLKPESQTTLTRNKSFKESHVMISADSNGDLDIVEQKPEFETSFVAQITVPVIRLSNESITQISVMPEPAPSFKRISSRTSAKSISTKVSSSSSEDNVSVSTKKWSWKWKKSPQPTSPVLLPSPTPIPTRYDLELEKQIYKLSHQKLSEKRPLVEQVLVSNLMLYILSVHADVTLSRGGKRKKKRRRRRSRREGEDLVNTVPDTLLDNSASPELNNSSIYHGDLNSEISSDTESVGRSDLDDDDDLPLAALVKKSAP